MKKVAYLLSEDGTIVNRIVYDENVPYTPPDGLEIFVPKKDEGQRRIDKVNRATGKIIKGGE